MMWPNPILRQFQIALTNNLEASDFIAPYHKLLNDLFRANTPYTVIPRSFPTSPLEDDWVATFEVHLVINKPLLILELRAPADSKSISARRLADTQIMQHMAELRRKS
jgi:hypothetical protein